MNRITFLLAAALMMPLMACDDDGEVEIDICSDDIDCDDGFICEITDNDDGICVEDL